MPSYAYVDNTETTVIPPNANLDLRAARSTTDPDLSYANLY